ncbi:hypothetical protein Q1695_010818 [Nippostrongylus brasiliensis]|nr:hypothetical protein Q1695_010818 [Nippostrongylus brasiliensis]
MEKRLSADDSRLGISHYECVKIGLPRPTAAAAAVVPLAVPSPSSTTRLRHGHELPLTTASLPNTKTSQSSLVRARS